MGISVETRRVVRVTFDADEWELYDEPGREDAARAINQAFEVAVNGGSSQEDVAKATIKMMNKYASFGAADTEGYSMLNRLLKKVYGGDAKWY